MSKVAYNARKREKLIARHDTNKAIAIADARATEEAERIRLNALMSIGQVKYGSCSHSTSYKVEKLSDGEKVMFWWIDSYGVPSEHGLILESEIKEVAEGYSQW